MSNLTQITNKIQMASDYETLAFWCPKSCIEEMVAEMKFEDTLPIIPVTNHTSFSKSIVLTYSNDIVTIDSIVTIKMRSAVFLIEKCEITYCDRQQ
jgi:hypothetical protein